MEKDTLRKVIKLLESDTGLTPVIGVEIEFYLAGNARDNDCLALIMADAHEHGIRIHGIELESGERQYEISITPDNPINTAKNIEELINIIKDAASRFDMEAIFAAKPYENQPGSGLQINLSLVDKAGKNIFKKDGEEEPPELLYAIGGLLQTMLESFRFFAPFEESYKRFTAQKNENVPDEKWIRKYNNAPVNVSWGGNNRTTAIRIPTSTLYPDGRHIEHRVAGADADPYDVISAILSGAHHGLRNKILPPERIHGNAFDKQYNMQPFPASLEEAKKGSRHSRESGNL